MPKNEKDVPIEDIRGLFADGICLPLREVAHMTGVKPFVLKRRYLTRENGFTERDGLWSYNSVLSWLCAYEAAQAAEFSRA